MIRPVALLCSLLLAAGLGTAVQPAVATVPATTGAAPAATAPASPSLERSKTFRLSTGTSGGYVTAYGRLNFTSKRAVRYRIWLRDVCPQDGWGAQLLIYTESGARKDPDQNPRFLRNGKGCGKKKTKTFSGTMRNSKGVRNARMQLCEKRNPYETQNCEMDSFYNPRRG